MFDIILSPLLIEVHMEQGKGPSLEIAALDSKVDEVFLSIQNMLSSMDTILSMQKMLFKRLGILLMLEQEVQVCESL
jgi:hypothetical protein